MATELLATNTTAASSAEFTLATGDATVVVMKDWADSTARAYIELKLAAGSWIRVYEMTPAFDKRSGGIAFPGTYRVTRVAGAACGVERG